MSKISALMMSCQVEQSAIELRRRAVLQGRRAHHVPSHLEGFQQHFEISTVRQVHGIHERRSRRIGAGQPQMALTSCQQQCRPNDDTVLPRGAFPLTQPASTSVKKEVKGVGNGIMWNWMSLPSSTGLSSSPEWVKATTPAGGKLKVPCP